jgi:GNAT superfamily N-acetyltransferase
MTIETDPSPADIQFIMDGLNEYNRSQTGYDDYLPLASFIREESGAILAGILGSSWGGWCHIRLLWVRADQRRRGCGRQLLEEAEAEAARRGCRTITLDTFSFQAPGFYQMLGYRVVGVYEDCPVGFSRIYLQKGLDI